MLKPRFTSLLAILLLAGPGAPAVRAQSCHGKLAIDADGTWILKVLDYEPKLDSMKGDYRDWPDILQFKPMSNSKGFFEIRRTHPDPVPGSGADPRDPKYFWVRMEKLNDTVELRGGQLYTLRFPYGNVGVKSFRHVLNLYALQQTHVLFAFESQATGTTLDARGLAQADYDPSYGDFKGFRPGNTNAYTFLIDGRLGASRAEDRSGDGDNVILHVTPVKTRRRAGALN